MIISQIAQILNGLASKSPGHIAKIQSYRRSLLEKKYLHGALFGQKAVKDDAEYGYHHGGRTELQFNIGFLEKNAVKMLYYGLALSFERSRDVPNPLQFFEQHRLRINALIHTMAEQFTGLEMWHLSGEIKKKTRQLNGPYHVREIPTPQPNDFFVIGKWAKIPKDQNDPVFTEIIRTFEQLFPIYWAGTFDEELPGLENRLARLCFNTKKWQQPSGPEGKSGSNQSYEKKQGYGHDEWFFDQAKTLDGWHYAYLRPVFMFWDTYAGKRFDVKLYTRAPDSAYVFIGEVRNLEVINKTEADRILQQYAEKGWLQEMIDQANQFATKPVTELKDLFNVRFRPENAVLFETPIGAQPDDIPFGRYMFYKKIIERPKKQTFKPRPPSHTESLQNTIQEFQRSIQEQTTFIKDIHSAIQDQLHQYLYERYGNCIEPEATIAGGGQRIDLKFRDKEDKFTLLEIKTYENDIRTCIRQALGQLLEYAYYDDDIDQYSRLIIVSQNPLDEKNRDYLRYLCETLKLPLGYLHFDWENQKIADQFNCTL